MSSHRSDCDHAVDAGAYLLRALPPEDHDEFAAHLRTCHACRHEVEHLQIVVDTLPIAAPQLAPPPELKDRIMRVVDAEAELLRAAGPEADRVPKPKHASRRARWGSGLFLRPVVAGALASVFLALGVVAGLLASNDSEPATRSVLASVSAPGATATVSLTSNRAALHVKRLPAPPPGKSYQVWLKRGDVITPTHTIFNVRKSDGAAVVAIEESVEGADQILVTDEPDGGSPSPTGDQLISANLD